MTRDREWVIHRYHSLGSTMDRASRMARFGAPERTAVVSAEQTAGRGRGGRVWQSARDAALYITLILRPEVRAGRLSTLSLIIGVAVAEAIEVITGGSPRLKWPNDVWLGDDPLHQKVAGILLTSSLSGQEVDHVLVGIGINTCAQWSVLPEGATSLSQATGVRAAPDDVLKHLLERVDRCYRDYLAADGRPSLDPWRARAALLGEPVSIEDNGKKLRGTFVGIDDDGALLLQSGPGRVTRIVAGDLVRGPRRA